MSTRIECPQLLALMLLVGGGLASAHADAAGPIAPAHPLDDPAALKSAFAERIGRPVNVLQFNLGEHYAEALVQDAKAGDEFDRYAAIPGQAMAEGAPQKAGSIDCRKKIAFADLDLATGARVLAQARAIAASNNYKPLENVELGSDIFCKAFGWRAILLTDNNSDTMLEITWAVDGASAKAQQMHEHGWVKVDMKALLAGAAKPPAAVPKVEPKAIAGDGRAHDFLHGIDADLLRVQAQVGAPLGFKHIRFDKTQLSVDVLQPFNKKRVSTWLVDDGGAIKLWHEDDTIPFDCNKPFTTSDFPLASLPQMIATAPSMIPPMAQGWVKDVAIYRSGFCGAPHVIIQVEDERGYGNVEYDQRGKLVSAQIR